MDLTQIRVLVADDEPKLRALVANALRALGCSVVEAQDGDEAWQIAQQRRVDVVVLDVMMPGMSGWDVCRRLKTDRSLRESPGGAPKVLMLTGIGEAVNEMTSPLFSADAWLDKPFSMREMTAKVLELAQGSGGPPASLPPDVLPETPRPVPWDPDSTATVASFGPSVKKVTRAVPELEGPAARAAKKPRPKAAAKAQPKPRAKPAAKAKAKPAAKAKAKAPALAKGKTRVAAKAKGRVAAKAKAKPAPKAKASRAPKTQGRVAAKPKTKAAAKPKRRSSQPKRAGR